ncbi:hypothetical protein CO614_02000 [Lysobacteraceae bacterium NML120232]|nr:hypothetical protein CO614_02000 [Xanthomonadaceae bacterium NML120232]
MSFLALGGIQHQSQTYAGWMPLLGASSLACTGNLPWETSAPKAFRIENACKIFKHAVLRLAGMLFLQNDDTKRA